MNIIRKILPSGIRIFSCSGELLSASYYIFHAVHYIVITFYSNNSLSIVVKSVFVGPCHHGMARPQVADRGTASDMGGSCE